MQQKYQKIVALLLAISIGLLSFPMFALASIHVQSENEVIVQENNQKSIQSGRDEKAEAQHSDAEIRYIVLVLDCSGAKRFTFPRTWDNVFGGSYTADSAIEEVKESAQKFLSDLSQTTSKYNNKIALVTYGGDAGIVECGFTENFDAVRNIVSGLENKHNHSDIVSGLDTAYSLMSEITDDNCIKNIVFCTTGLASGERVNYDGYYKESDTDVPSDWKREEDEEKLYACANAAIDSANVIKDANINIYVLGIFNPIESVLPWNGKVLANFFRRTAKDISSGDGYFFSVEDTKDLDFAFGELEEGLIGLKTVRIYNDCNYFNIPSCKDDVGGSDHLSGNYEEVSWGPALFETPSTQLYRSAFDSEESINRSLGLLSASLCVTSYNHQYLVQAYKDLGFSENDIYLYSYPDSPYNRSDAMRNSVAFAGDADLAFSIASKEMNYNGVTSDLLVIVAKGTQSSWEIIKDATCVADKDFYGYLAWDWIYEFEEDVMSGLNDYMQSHEVIGTRPLKVLLTGHSLGGACANLVAARLNKECGSEGSFAEALSINDIFAFTFGAIDSISKTDSIFSYSLPVTDGYENIINVYNLLDTFGANGSGAYGIKELTAKGNTIEGKFGDIYGFTSDLKGIISDEESGFSTHEMIGYLYAVKQGWPVSENRGGKIRICVMCPVSIEIFNEKESVCVVSPNEVTVKDSNIAAAKVGETKVVILPSDIIYDVHLIGTGSGEMELLIEEFGSDNSAISDYCHVPIENDKLLNFRLDDITPVEEIGLYTCDSDGTPAATVSHDGLEVELDNGPSTFAVILKYVIIIAIVIIILAIVIIIIK